MNSFTVLVLVCAASVPRAGCNPQTALDVIRGPDVQNETMCGFHGQALYAETAMSTNMADNKYLKILCSRTSVSPAAGKRLPWNRVGEAG